MNFNELLPIFGGLFIGSLLCMVRRSQRIILGTFLTLLLGLLATFASGEFAISWAFILIDIPLAAVSGLAGFAITYYLRSFFKSPI